MASLQYHQLLFIVSLLSFYKVLPLPSLLFLNCTLPSQNTLINNNKHIQVPFDNLTSLVTKPRFIASTTELGPDQLNSLMECRSDLSSATCNLCVQNAKRTIPTLCPNAIAVTAAWFDGCYLHYYHHHNYGMFSHAFLDWFCSNQANVTDWAQFERALETLLIRLRAEVSSGELQFGNGGRVYALVECVHDVSPKECEVCVEKGIERLYEYCGGRELDIVVAGYCMVRYESHRLLLNGEAGNGSNGNGSGAGMGLRSGDGGVGVGMSFKVKVAFVWGVGVACLVVVVFSAWLLRRSVVNTAKVATHWGADDDEMGSKAIV